ncbi:MAG TPA: cupin domain-containing protein [Nocardioides sp.]|nr:cupin domain-containing protein [Nocardioides sp.]
MDSTSLPRLAEEQLAIARTSSSGRSSVTVFGGREHDLRQTLISLAAGHALGEHESPGEATLQVLTGAVRLTAGDEVWDGGAGDLLVIPPHRHDLQAVTDAAVLLTVASRA